MNSVKKIPVLHDPSFDWATLAVHKDDMDKLERIKEKTADKEKKNLYRYFIFREYLDWNFIEKSLKNKKG